MGIPSVSSSIPRAVTSTASSTASTASSTASTSSTSGTGSWLQQGLNLVGGVLGMGGSGGSGSTEDQTKAMIDSYVFGNLEKMRDEAEAKMKEAMKKGDPGAV